MALDYSCPNCGMKLGYDGLCYICREEKERMEVLNWSEEEIEKKVEYLIENAEKIGNWRNKENEITEQLICYHGRFPQKLQKAAAEKNVFNMDKLYYHAPAEVRDIIIEKLMNTKDSLQASRLLQCLAMQGDEKTLEVMYELEKNPKEWRKELYVEPSVYAECGGWTFDKNKNKKMLNYEKCYPLIKGHKNDVKASPVKIGRPRKVRCSFCNGLLTDMLVMDCRDERLKFIGIDGIFTATCCPNCVPYVEAYYSRYTLDGGSQVIEEGMDMEENENYIGDDGIKSLSENTFVLADKPVGLFYASEGDAVNTIGGFASWVQDWQYAKCPDCGEKMKYVAQLHWGILTDDEGTLYIEVCKKCQVAAMIHQQT